MHAWEAIDESLVYIEEHLSEEIETKVLADGGTNHRYCL